MADGSRPAEAATGGPEEATGAPPAPPLRRIGHKGADAIRPGNTVESFRAAVEAGVDMIEMDVLWTRDGHPARDPRERAPLVVAHDWHDAARREPMTLAEALDSFGRPPLDGVEIDLDLKLPGREDEVAAALRDRGLIGRASVSTMEVSTLEALRDIAPDLRRGWTYPKVKRAWDRKRWARPMVFAALVRMRRRLPALLPRHAAELGLTALWAFHPLVSARLVRAAAEAEIELIAWTVDDPERIGALRDLGVDGICSNDPRLLK